MFINKSKDGLNNVCGRKVAALRKSMKPKVSQRALAQKLQVAGLDVDKNAVQRIESGPTICHRYRTGRACQSTKC